MARRYDRASLVLALLMLAALLAGCERDNRANQQPQNPAAPPRFQALYGQLEQELSGFQAAQAAPPADAALTFGAELITANSHRGEALFEVAAMEGSRLLLDRLKALGIGGVTVQIGYPLLAEDFPRANDYLEFYRQIAAEVRSREMLLHVKTGVLFRQAAFTSLDLSYENLTVDDYFRERQREAEIIAREIQPDYLTIGNEPSSEGQIIGQELSVDRYTQYINDTVQAIKPAPTLLGAGSGSWDPIDYVQRFAETTELDFIDIHTYPLSNGRASFLQRTVEMADLARANGKRVIIGEFWLYKASPQEMLRGLNLAEIFARDTYSFWAPLDAQMLQTITTIARGHQIEYISPFWTKYLFAYLEFDQNRLSGAAQLTTRSDQAAARAIVDNQYSDTGRAYQRIISGE